MTPKAKAKQAYGRALYLAERSLRSVNTNGGYWVTYPFPALLGRKIRMRWVYTRRGQEYTP